MLESRNTSKPRSLYRGYPVGGVALDYLQYVIGLARLGHDVYYHEDTWSWPYHPVERTNTAQGDYSAQYFDRFFARYAPELRQRWHYLHVHETSYGMDRAAFDAVARPTFYVRRKYPWSRLPDPAAQLHMENHAYAYRGVIVGRRSPAASASYSTMDHGDDLECLQR